MGYFAKQDFIDRLNCVLHDMEGLSRLMKSALESLEWDENQKEAVRTASANLEVRAQGIAYEVNMRLAPVPDPEIDPVPHSNTD